MPAAPPNADALARARRRSGAALLGLFLGALLASPLSLHGQSPAASGAPPGKTALPAVEEILKKAIERARRDQDQKIEGKYAYTQHSTIEELDSKENVRKREERVLQILPIDGEPYARLVQKDGKPLSEKDAKLEQERERRFRRRLAERKRKKEHGKKDDDEVDFDEELVSKYRFILAGREPVNRRAAYVLSFEPRSADLPVKRKIDRLLNKVAGRLWIDEQDYAISRVDLHLAENVLAWGGLLASVRKFLLQVEQSKVDEAAWLPCYVDGYIDGRILIRSLHMKVKQQNSDFRKVPPGAGPRDLLQP